LIIINVVIKKKEYLKSVCHLPSDVNSKQTRNIVDKLVEKDGSITKCEQQLLSVIIRESDSYLQRVRFTQNVTIIFTVYISTD
jgi:hypothetical protein